MSEIFESLIVEPILEIDVLDLEGPARAFFKRAGHEFPANAKWLFRPLHPGDYAGGLMYDAKGRKMEADLGYTVVAGMIAIDEHVVFPLEFAYMLEVQIDTSATPFTWSLPGTLPGQGGWSIQLPANTGTSPHTWTSPPTFGPTLPSWPVQHQGTVYYGTITVGANSAQNSAQGVSPHTVTLNDMNASPDMTIPCETSVSWRPTTIADFAAIHAAGATITNVTVS